MKKLLIPALLASGSVFAAPFDALDTRSMAMGDTGVASSKPGSAATFNPALLSHYNDDYTVSIILPNIGVSAVADQDALDGFTNISDEDYLGEISNSINFYDNAPSSGDFQRAAHDLANNTRGLNEQLGYVSGKPINVNAGGMFSVAIPNKTFGFAVYANAQAVVEVSPNISECDQKLFDDYAKAADEAASDPNGTIATDKNSICGTATRNIYNSTTKKFIDPTDTNGDGSTTTSDTYMTSSFSLSGVTISEFGLAMAHEFNILGKDISFGITPKMMEITSYYANPTVEQLDSDNYELSDEFEASEKTDNDFNMDIAMAMGFLSEDAITVGFTIKNIMSKSYTTSAGTDFKVSPQARAGVAWDLPLGFTLASDLDLTKNKPYFNGDSTQYWGVGAEWDVFSVVRLRGGMRTNLANSDDTALTAGIGFNIFVVHFDLAGQFSENNAAVGFQLGMEF